MKKPKVSIVILSWNTKRLLRQCLKSLILNIKHQILNLEIIVVDNGSTDGSPEMVKKEFSAKGAPVRLIENKTNLGFAKGNNLGISAAKGKYIMLFNSDTIVEKGAIEKLASFLDKSEPGAGGVSPLLLNQNETIQEQYYMKFPNLWQVFLYHHPLLRRVIISSLFKKLISEEVGDSYPRPVDQLPGAAMMVKRDAFEKVGLLDEDYRFLYEDVDWCFRAKKLGYRLVLVPEARITHLGGGSWGKVVRKTKFDFYRQFFSSLLLFVKKNYPQDRFLIFRTAVALNFLLQGKFRLAKYFLMAKDPSTQVGLW